MKFSIDSSVLDLFPDVCIGLLHVKDVSNDVESSDISNLLSEEIDRVRREMTLDSVSSHPTLLAWREAYRAFGGKPKKYRCSIENLYRMILNDVVLDSINPLVDLYNVISLKHGLPVGGDDLSCVDGDVRLIRATGDEPFMRLKSDEVDHPKPGEVVYMDEKEVLCRRWNWRECEKSKMTNKTQEALLVVEGILPTTKEDVHCALEELSRLISLYCGGSSAMHILSAGLSEVEL